MKIKEMSADLRPREKLLKFGIENLSNAEILAIVLRTGTRGKKGEKGENVIEMADRVIQQYGLDKLSECSLKELQEINGIGPAKAMQIQTLFEFNKRHNMAKHPVKKITCAKDVFDLFHERLKDEKQENFYILMLDTKNNIIKEQLITKGILDSSIVHPREIFKPAIKNSASKIVLVHNHPSGDSDPSSADLEVINKLIETGEELGIKVLDSLILGGDNYCSWKEKSA